MADESAVASGTVFADTSGFVDLTATWSTTTDGGLANYAAEGADFVSYEGSLFGNQTGSLQLGFDNAANDPDDYVTIVLTFSQSVTQLNFSLLDVDTGSWDDGVEIFYNGANNVLGDPSVTVTLGAVVVPDDETYLAGYEGNGGADNDETTGNIGLDFGSNAVTSVRIRYLCTDDADADPGGQRIAVSNMFFDVPVDHGDAPDTAAGTGAGNYRTLRSDSGPRHLLVGYDAGTRTTSLMLGATVDDEADGQPNAGAAGDDTADVDDENGISTFPALLTSATSYTIPAASIATTNTTGSTATLYGFIDFNLDGDFADAGESTSASVPNGAANPSSALTWSGFTTPLTAGSTIARFRISTIGGLTATGAALDGEVEDHLLTITPPPMDTPTPTDTSISTPTDTSTPTPTDTSTPTDTATPNPTETSTPTPTDTATETPTDTPTATPTDTSTPTPTDTATGAAQAVDPAVTKSGDPATASIGDTIVFTLVITNNGSVVATNVRVVDPIPSFLTVTNVVSSPAETANNTVGNAVDLLYATVTPTDVYTVTITTIVNSSATPPGAPNVVTLTADDDDDPTNNIDSTTITIVVGGAGAPETGFAPGRITYLPPQPADVAYTEYGELWLEIPSIGVETSIVGVPSSGGGWDVTWLGEQAGYLNGTAFPTWAGNSVITAHVGLASGQPGPFVDLKSLRFGDRVVIHAWGLEHIYEIQEVALVSAADREVFRHEERSWLTLVTCHGYDEREASYRWRIAARAVLVSIATDGSLPAPAVLLDEVPTAPAGPPGLSGGR